jgi:hypothetical protein
MMCLKQLLCLLTGGHTWQHAAIERKLSYFDPEDEPIIAVQMCKWCRALKWKN